MEFEWCPEKDVANFEKHGVTFSEAATVFGDPFEMTIVDPDHSEGEFRFLSIGRSRTGQLLVVAYTERDCRIRIITARPAISREIRHYESQPSH